MSRAWIPETRQGDERLTRQGVESAKRAATRDDADSFFYRN